jgi:hypothetical protein
MKDPYVITVKCLVDGSVDAETERRNLFASCQDSGLNVLYSDIQPANKIDLAVAKNREFVD